MNRDYGYVQLSLNTRADVVKHLRDRLIAYTECAETADQYIEELEFDEDTYLFSEMMDCEYTYVRFENYWHALIPDVPASEWVSPFEEEAA